MGYRYMLGDEPSLRLDGEPQAAGAASPPGEKDLAAAESPLSPDPMDDYRRCEMAMHDLLARYLHNTTDVRALTSALMTHAQQYALSWARLYRDVGAQSRKATPRPGDASRSDEPL
jgi:hypothetical protein